MFYERLNLLCKQHGTTITEVVSAHLGVGGSAATKWKQGSAPRSDVVVRAAEHFGVTTDYLLGLSDIAVIQSPADSPELEVQQAAAMLRGASDTARTAAIAAMQAIIATLDATTEKD